MYATTREFLERFGLNDLSDLPKVEEMSDALGFELPMRAARAGAHDRPAAVRQRSGRRTRRAWTRSRNGRSQRTKQCIDPWPSGFRRFSRPRASRPAARRKRYITQGRVSVNGTTVTELGSKADPDADDIRVDGRRVKSAAAAPLHPPVQTARLHHHPIRSAAPSHRHRSARRKAACATTSIRSGGSTTSRKACCC